MILGYDEAGEGPPLLLVHAFPADRRIWAGQLAGLADVARVVAVDLRGRGKSVSGEPAPHRAEHATIDQYADDVAETIEALGAGPVHAGGISLGGYVLFSLWRRHPEKVRSLILVSTRATEDPPEGKEGRKRVAALVREKGTSELVPMMFSKLFAPGTPGAIKQRALQMVEDLPPEAAAGDSLAMGMRPDSTGDLPGISVPALVLHGENDELLPLDAARQMAAQIPGAGFVPIPGSAHFTTMENPAAVNEAVRSFLSSQTPIR